MRKLYAIILMVFLSFSCGMLPAYAAETATQDGWILLPSQENVALDKVWTVKFSSIVTNNLVAGIVIEKDASSIPITVTFTDQKEAKVKADSSYLSNSKYAIKVTLTNGKKYVMNFTTSSVVAPDPIVPTDYSQSAHWLSLPTEATKKVDVFYLYPSAWAKVNADDPIICEIDNPIMLKQSKLAYFRQATAFETIANIYAPYYRQDDAGSTLQLPFKEQQDIVKGVPLTDATAAFEYYLEHYNNGRPFILASHSQGSNVMIYILQDYMKEHPDVYKRMVAAYVIGYSITDDYLVENPNLKFATGAEDTGVIISYNTQAPTIEGINGVVLPTAHVINPISWTTEETVAPASDNLGSLQLNKDGSVVSNPDGTYVKVMNFADAHVDKTKGVIICSTVNVDRYAPGSAMFGKGIFHSFDYPFYYYNIRANAEERVANYLKEHKDNTQ